MSDIEGYAEFEARMLQSQSGTTVSNNCYISGNFNICPAQADFTFSNVVKRLTANLTCPLSAVAQSDFRQASQQGLCSCNATVQDLNQTNSSPQPLNCECFICPNQPGLFGVAYSCSTPVSGPCHTFNCKGICNGNLNFLPGATKSPTQAPAGPSSSAFAVETPGAAVAVMLLWTVVRMFR